MVVKFLCDHTDCLIHPKNEANVSAPTYSVAVNGQGLSFSNSSIQNNTLKIKDVEFLQDGSNSELKIHFLAYDLEVPFECLFCNNRQSVDMKNEILKHKTKSLLGG